MMRNHQLLPWLASVLAVLTLSGCMGDTTGDLREWVRQERKNAKPNIQPLSEPKAFTPQPYTTADLMDPFNVLKLTSALRLDSEKRHSQYQLAGTRAQSSQTRTGKLPPGCHLDGWKHAPKWQRNCFSTGEQAGLSSQGWRIYGAKLWPHRKNFRKRHSFT